MLSHIEEDVPELLMQRNTVAYCSQLHVKQTKSSLLLSRQLKFYEFRKKVLLHHIDLRDSGLMQLATELLTYSGPIHSFLIRDDVTMDISSDSTSYSMLHAVEDLPLSIGKYVWLNEEVYLLLRCWHKLLVLQRPKLDGAPFLLIAQFDNLQDYRLVRSPIKYQAHVELHFTNGKRLRTNFQTANTAETPAPTGSAHTVDGFHRLLARVHYARAELQAQRVQTELDFGRARDRLAFGVPGQRSPLLEEKQLLRRCGDLWTRICGDCLVLGTLLTNATGNNRCSTLHALRPLLCCLPAGCGLNYAHRLYELPMQSDGQSPEDYDGFAQFGACYEEHSAHSNGFNWPPAASIVHKLAPESSSVLLLRLQLDDLMALEEIQLLVTYELHAADANDVRQLQLQVATIKVGQLLQQQSLHVPSFGAATLHQDFLAVIMAQTAHCALRLQFQGVEQQTQFEQLLIGKWGYVATMVPQTDQQQQPTKQQQEQEQQGLEAAQLLDDFVFDNRSHSGSCGLTPTGAHHCIFYNRSSEVLLLHNEPGQHWHLFARSQTQLGLLLRRLQQDLLQLHCNLSLLRLEHEAECRRPANAALLLESALRDELQARAELFQAPAASTASKQRRLHQLEMANDLLISVISS
ncbi:uncharacterized protein LOC6566231 [Drosophila grimshawi]|uniref:GH24479 n=1 Tax=Drosophila grimshawi TaxID=7222 RepID=B4JLN6_DROGR|nr:uncharacterized protein LOC6566231 [Drosophila grimshawi]EDV91647.1 GH24479 [Drosophila grimshawi]